jgi:shikimate kinase
VLVLLGLRCSGKSTLGRRLATELGRAFVDGDEATLAAGRQAGQRVGSAGELLARVGQATFRELESGALRRLLEPGPRIVLATGGGVVERADNRTWLARCARCVYLDVPLARLAERLRADPTPRPALLGVDPAEELGELFRRRDPLYRALAELVLACDDDPPKTLAARVLAELGAL